MAPKITATVQFGRETLTDVPVLNPGDWFGKAWLVEIGGSFTPLYVVVEADNVSDAIDEFSDDKTYGHQIHVDDSDLSDYPEDERHYDGNGRVIDLDWLMVHGRENQPLPIDATYHVEGFELGVNPPEFDWSDFDGTNETD